MTETTIFLHGLDSSGQGTKGTFFTNTFPTTLCPNFTGNLHERLEALERLCQDVHSLTIIGSSFGGLMATCYTIDHPGKVRKLILLAPALNFEDFQVPEIMVETPTLLIIGDKDVVTPPQLVLPLARKTFQNIEVIVADDDHLLHDTFMQLDWPKLLTGN